MKKVVLDTSFILSCIRKKIDFFEEIKFMGFQILIPKQVIREINGITISKKKSYFKEDSKLALELLKKNLFKEIDLKEKNVDKGLIKLAKKDKEIIVATLDKEIQNNIQNPKLIIRGQKKLQINQ
jgi:rRNA-processing protein FCF1